MIIEKSIKGKNMEIFIIILNYLNYKDTIQLVGQLKEQQNITIRIVIVDNNSPNESYTTLSNLYKDDNLINVLKTQKNGGYSFGNNVGLKFIKRFNPVYVGILNNDIIITDKLLIFKLIDELNNHLNVYLCSPAMIINGKEQFNAWKVPSIYDSLKNATRFGQMIFDDPMMYNYPKEKKTEKVECVPGSFFICNYSKFESLGFFDEDIFLFGEETILGFKIKKAGGINLLCRQYNFNHLWSKSINTTYDKVARIKLQLKGKEIFHKKYQKVHWSLYYILKLLHKIRIVEERCRLFILKYIKR